MVQVKIPLITWEDPPGVTHLVARCWAEKWKGCFGIKLACGPLLETLHEPTDRAALTCVACVAALPNLRRVPL